MRMASLLYPGGPGADLDVRPDRRRLVMSSQSQLGRLTADGDRCRKGPRSRALAEAALGPAPEGPPLGVAEGSAAIHLPCALARAQPLELEASGRYLFIEAAGLPSPDRGPSRTRAP